MFRELIGNKNRFERFFFPGADISAGADYWLLTFRYNRSKSRLIGRRYFGVDRANRNVGLLACFEEKPLSLSLPLPLSFSITLALGLSLSRSFLEILGLLGTASFLAAACLSFFEIHLCSFLLLHLHLLPFFFCFPCRQFLKSKALLISSGLVRSSRLLHFHIPPLPRAAAAAVVAVAVGAAAAAARCSPGFSSRPKKTSVIGFRLRDRDRTSRRERMDNFF